MPVTNEIGKVEGREIGARILPLPSTVSSAMRELLRRDYHFPVPKTMAEWREFVDSAHTEHAQLAQRKQLAELKGKLGVDTTEHTIGGVRCYKVTPRTIEARHRHRLLVDLHAGGWMGGGESASLGAIILAGLTGIRSLAIDFRVLPDHPFPAAMDDCLAVWQVCVNQIKPEHTAVTGSSAGAAMVLSFIQRAKREGLPIPAAAVSDSPFADLSKTGDSYCTNEEVDNRIHRYDGFLEALARLYANGRDLKDPLVSPVYGDFHGFPPTLLVSGTRDLWLSHAARVQSKLLEAGVPNQLIVGEGLTHGIIQEAVLRDVPEGFAIYSHIVRFLDAHLAS